MDPLALIPANVRIPAAVAGWLLLPAAFLIGQCDGEVRGKRQVEAAHAIAEAEIIKRDGEAKDAAAVEERVDNALIADNQKELLDAVAAAPPSLPSPARVAVACQRLRNAGRTDIPPVCGPDGGAEAGNAP
jgi:hypothetical protein